MTASSHPPSPPPTTKQPGRWTIRPAHQGDIAGIAQLGRAVFAATFGHSVTAAELAAYLDATYSPEAIARDLHDATRDVVVATTTPTMTTGDGQDDDEMLLGFAYLTRGTTEPCLAAVGPGGLAELQRLYVGRAAQGAGVGAALAAHVAARARAQGFRHLWLGVWEHNERALRAYAKWGYRRVGEHHFDVGPVRQTDHVMLKDLY